MNTRNSVILALVVILLSLAISAFAGGNAYTWTLGKPSIKDGICTIKVMDQCKNTDTVHCNMADLQGLMAYLNAPNSAALEGRKFEGNNLEKDLNAARDWAFNMSKEDKEIETLAKGILTFKNFDSDVILGQSENFICVNGTWRLNKGIFSMLYERTKVMSDGKCELVEANINDFSIIPRSMCFVALAIKSTAREKISIAGIQNIDLGKRTRFHKFTLAADCTNAVQFDAPKQSEQR